MTDRTCPSARAEAGATLLGIRGPGGRVVPVRTAMTVDDAFVEDARRYGSPEARMRFAAPCREGGCTQWTGSACGVIAKVMAQAGTATAPTALRPCVVRRSCRWFAEHGAAACGVCDLVVTDQTEVSPA